MRTLITHTTADGVIMAPYFKEQDDLPDALGDMLAEVGLTSLTKNMKDGSKITYNHWEYDCTLCGSYDHTDEDHPEKDDEDEADVEAEVEPDDD